MKKLGRNDPCWCGSGKKYKACHLKREKRDGPTIQEVQTHLKRAYSKKYCLHPKADSKTCQGGIVKAHLLQKNGGLSRIAENGHVLSLRPDPALIGSGASQLRAKPIGINNASTFTGFCNHHDNNTFKLIEKKELEINNETMFQLAYRPLCQELFNKSASKDLLPFMRTLDRGRSMPEQLRWQQFVEDFGYGVSLGLKDLHIHKRSFDEALLAKDFSAIRYYVVEFDSIPGFLCAGILAPEYSFNGKKRLQNLGDFDRVMDLVSVSVVPKGDGAIVALVWLGEADSCKELAQSMKGVPPTEFPQALTRYLFTFLENVYISPSWWNELSPETQELIAWRARAGTPEDVGNFSIYLQSDAMQYVTSHVVGEFTNVNF